MNRARLQNFVRKYLLSGTINSAVWEIKGDTLHTDSISSDHSLIAFVSMKNFDMDTPDGSLLGMGDTGQLLKLINLMELDIELTTRFNKRGDPLSIQISDGTITANFALSESPSITKPTEAADTIPESWDATLMLDADDMDKLVKSISALQKVKSFVLIYDKVTGKTKLVVGHSKNNSNSVSIEVDVEYEDGPLTPMPFSAIHLKEIISANKDADEIVMRISEIGLANISFDIMDFKSDYYLVEIDGD